MFIRAVLFLSILSVIALPAVAEEKVWYCEMPVFRELGLQKDKTFSVRRFSMRVSPAGVKFPQDSHLEGLFADMVYFESQRKWRAEKQFDDAPLFVLLFTFEDGQLQHTFMIKDLVQVLMGTCDDL